MHLLTVILITGITLITKGHALVCYDCIPGPGNTGESLDCKKIESRASCDEHQNCAARTIKLEAKKVEYSKHCINADLPCGSVNMGVNYYREDCCSTDYCNHNFSKTPDKLHPNGLECCTGKDNNCTNVLNCTEEEDRCINGTVTIGTVVLTGYGCASKNMCVDQPEATCCKENRCNGERIHPTGDPPGDPTGDPPGDTSRLRTPAVIVIVIVIVIIVIAIAVYLWKNRRTWFPGYTAANPIELQER